MSPPLSAEAREKILRLLRAGNSVHRIAETTGHAQRHIREIRDAAGIPAYLRGARQTPRTGPAEDVAEETGVGLGDPWIPPAGFDPHAERPHQVRWVAMQAAAGPAEQDRMWEAVRSVIGVSKFASPEGVRRALVADRRTADELARLYLAEHFREVP